jgi:hypothetical protein
MTGRFTRQALAALVFVLGGFAAIHADGAAVAHGHAITLTAKVPSTARVAPVQPTVAPKSETPRVALLATNLPRQVTTRLDKHDLHGEVAPRGPPSA